MPQLKRSTDQLSNRQCSNNVSLEGRVKRTFAKDLLILKVRVILV